MADTNTRPRILALCGAKSNSEVTKLQLENLAITDESYDIFYLQGWKEEEEGDPEVAGMVYGPFYSWLDTKKMNESVIQSVQLVLNVVAHYGPFDGVYGFSHGGFIASLVAGIASDELLQDAVRAGGGLTQQQSGTTLFGGMAAGTNAIMKRGPFKFAIIACGSITTPLLQSITCSVHGGAGSRAAKMKMIHLSQENGHDVGNCTNIESITCSAHGDADFRATKTHTAEEDGHDNRIDIKSFHIIGIEDERKTQSEGLASMFIGAHVMYHPQGHGISREIKNDDDMTSSIGEFVKTHGNPVTVPYSTQVTDLSEVSSMALQPNIQVALVQLKTQLLPEGLTGATILDLLYAQPSNKRFLKDARDSNGDNATTYGEVRRFIDGGAGDLRRLGVMQGDVVAYGAPPGGSAAAALAFLSIGAQTTAAPLAPGMTEPEVIDSLDQFNATHLIIFEGVDNPGIEAAFTKWSAEGKGVLHRARITGSPGMFEYLDQNVSNIDGLAPLRNPEDGACLLLRTSGTTARPKGVPLRHETLITNGAIIAKSMQLTDTDVCYSVMPLFHIGGISASILCTLASGGQVCCDGEPFDPSRMVDALAISNPQPTWYSSVPTIHNATVTFLREHAKDDPKFAGYGIDRNGIWEKGHSLRQIRSGAAALLVADGEALTKAYGDVPIYPTYSMSEQMPISQPPAGRGDTLFTKPGSVGCPVAASVAIVSRSHYRPQPYGMEGEIAICGKLVMDSYLDNPTADAKSYFYMTNGHTPMEHCRYFLTGDVGVIDSDGFLSLKGRAKELIKKGGEQVSPYEVEEALLSHPWVQTPVCFSVPSKVYGEEVGCALVLSSEAPLKVEDSVVIKQMRKWMKEQQFAPVKWPTKWIIVTDDELPKTKTRKYIRVGLAEKLGFGKEEAAEGTSKETKAKIDWGVITGFRFILACYVMFMHIGDNKSWGVFSNLRGWPWHVHVFYTLGGFSMASPMNPLIKKKFSYFLSRIGHMYPMYIMSLIFGLINLLVVCRPSTFRSTFHWDAQPDDLYLENGEVAPLFCEGTPATKTSYWASLFLTIIVYIFGLAVTPFWPLAWWMGYYLWFSSMYYQCLAFFPAVYNYFLEKVRKNTKSLLMWNIGLQVLNGVIMVVAWFSMRKMEGYNHYNVETGEPNDPSEYTDGVASNSAVLLFYLFGPFWALYFVIGIALAFLYDAYRPAERHNAHVWGWIADGCTLVMLGISITCICQGNQHYDEYPKAKYFRPSDADQFTDTAIIVRLWDNLSGRVMAPLTTLWIFALSTGEGFSASILRGSFLVDTLGPNSYNCFLFHQMVGQWYYAATRNGHMWNWWRYRKAFYWFSPGPCPVEWYEYFYVVGCVVFFSRFMDSTFTPFIKKLYTAVKVLFSKVEEEEDIDIGATLCAIIEKMTGIEPDMDSTLEEVGLASVGVPIIVGLLNDNFSKKKQPLGITSQDLVSAKTIEDMVGVVAAARARMEHDGV